MAPNKTDVLPFINNKGAAPPRYARATLVFGAASEPYLQDYTVGPLPVGSDTKAQPLQFLYNNKGGGKVDATALTVDTSGFLQDVALSVADITKRLWNAVSTLPLREKPPWIFY